MSTNLNKKHNAGTEKRKVNLSLIGSTDRETRRQELNRKYSILTKEDIKPTGPETFQSIGI